MVMYDENRAIFEAILYSSNKHQALLNLPQKDQEFISKMNDIFG